MTKSNIAYSISKNYGEQLVKSLKQYGIRILSEQNQLLIFEFNSKTYMLIDIGTELVLKEVIEFTVGEFKYRQNGIGITPIAQAWSIMKEIDKTIEPNLNNIVNIYNVAEA